MHRRSKKCCVFQLLSGAGHGFLHLGLQVLIIAYILTVGSLIDGVDTTFFGSTTSEFVPSMGSTA